MMPTGQQAAISLIAVIAAPVLVGQAAQAPVAEAPALAKSALTVQLDSTEQVSGSLGRILIHAAGPPPTESSLLTSESGLTTVKAEAGGGCKGLPVHQASQSPGGNPWCVRLDGISEGSSASGTLSGEKAEVTLKVNRSMDFWGTPVLVILAGLLAGGLVVLVPKWLRRSTREALLENLLEANHAAPEERRIGGLEEWVQKQRDAKKSDDEILPVAKDLVKRGPEIASRARAELRRAVALSVLPRSHPALVAARNELERRGYEVADFFDEEKRLIHPASKLAEVLTQLAAQALRLSELREEIEQLDAGQQAEPKKLLTAAEGRFDIVTSDAGLAKLLELVDELEQAIASARRRPIPLSRRLAVLAAEQPSALEGDAGLIAPLTSAPARPGALKLASRFAKPILVTIAVILVIVAWAGLTMKLAVYDPKPAFGSTADCLALLVAAVGSGAAGTILTTVSVWNPLSPAEEA